MPDAAVAADVLPAAPGGVAAGGSRMLFLVKKECPESHTRLLSGKPTERATEAASRRKGRNAALSFNSRTVGEFGQHMTVAGLWSAPTAEDFALQFGFEHGQQVRLLAEPLLVFTNDGGAVAVAPDCKRIAPLARSADIDVVWRSFAMDDSSLFHVRSFLSWWTKVH